MQFTIRLHATIKTPDSTHTLIIDALDHSTARRTLRRKLKKLNLSITDFKETGLLPFREGELYGSINYLKRDLRDLQNKSNTI